MCVCACACSKVSAMGMDCGSETKSERSDRAGTFVQFRLLARHASLAAWWPRPARSRGGNGGARRAAAPYHGQKGYACPPSIEPRVPDAGTQVRRTSPQRFSSSAPTTSIPSTPGAYRTPLSAHLISRRTFSQRYYENPTYYTPGGPAIICTIPHQHLARLTRQTSTARAR